MKLAILKIAFIVLFFSGSSLLFCQNVAINTGGNAPVTGALLDLSNNNSATGTTGFLPPWVTLTSASLLAPVTGTAANLKGLIVYNTSTSTANGLCGPGLYYWNGTIWSVLFVGSVPTPVAPSNITCAGYNTLAAGINTIQYSTTAVTGALSYAWTSSNPNVFTVPATTTTPTVTVTTVEAGSATLTVQAVFACTYSLSSPPATITIISNPTILTTVGNSSGTVPCYGTSTPAVYIYGGGGGGGGSSLVGTDFANGAGGGGGACGVFTTTPTFNTAYTYTVGTGGTAGSTTSPCTGGTGGTTTFTQSTPAGTWTIAGGTGGTGQTNGAANTTAAAVAGGSTGTGAGITIYAGGAGNAGHNGNSATTGYTGSGGGGAGNTGAGQAPSSNAAGCNTTGGAGGTATVTYYGGNGGWNSDCGTSTNLPGVNGSQPGGGGSGGNDWSTKEAGGAGGAGEVIILW